MSLNIISPMWNWIVSHWDWLITTGMLLLTLCFSFKTYLGRDEQRLGEAIRDIDEANILGNLKTKPVLHSCRFFPLKEAIVEFKFYVGTGPRRLLKNPLFRNDFVPECPNPPALTGGLFQ